MYNSCQSFAIQMLSYDSWSLLVVLHFWFYFYFLLWWSSRSIALSAYENRKIKSGPHIPPATHSLTWQQPHPIRKLPSHPIPTIGCRSALGSGPGFSLAAKYWNFLRIEIEWNEMLLKLNCLRFFLSFLQFFTHLPAGSGVELLLAHSYSNAMKICEAFLANSVMKVVWQRKPINI